MASVRIVTDSTAFLEKEIIDRYNIAVVPLYVNFPDEIFPDGSVPNAVFFEKVKKTSRIPFTSQPSPADFVKVFEQIRAAGDDIVSIHISSGISGTCESATTAAHMVDPEHIAVIDSLHTSGAQALLVIDAAEAAARGETREAIAALLEEKKKRLRIFFVPDTLEYLRKGGRIGGAQALLGTLLKIKPVLYFHNGQVDTYDKVRTMKKALERIVGEIPAAPGEFTLIIVHAEAHDTVKTLAAMIAARFPLAKIVVNELSPVIGTHAGPGVVGLCFYV